MAVERPPQVLSIQFSMHAADQSPANPSLSSPRSIGTVAPELLAPAGDMQCVQAAIENGADAVYFGLDRGFNARARAHNFSLQQLPDLMGLLHQRGLRGYVTFNTLVFPSELADAAAAIEAIAAAGVDAVLVQDIGIARLAREICPQLEIHASTQMTMTSGETIEVARQLGISRVVLARELSIAEIRKIRAKTDMPLEVFVHGALCVAYSGQCLTSESLGGRSANRGQCAQACRLPYELVVDGKDRDLAEIQYLLSPQDLAAFRLIPDLIAAGVCSLKIEGRLKTPEYVASVTGKYRQAIDQAMGGGPVALTDRQVTEMEISFSRGFSPGWLEGCDHKMLVPGDNSAKRGIRIGTVVKVERGRVIVHLDRPLACGDGVAFEGDRVAGTDTGGRVYEIFRRGKRLGKDAEAMGTVELAFGTSDLDLHQIFAGQVLWKTDDPRIRKRLRSSFSSADPQRRRPIDLRIIARVGEPLTVEATGVGETIRVTSDQPLETARRHGATMESLRGQFDRLGGTPFSLGRFSCEIDGQPMVPHSVTGVLRKSLVERLITAAARIPQRDIDRGAIARLDARIAESTDPRGDQRPVELWALCRTPDQIEGALAAGIKHLYVEYHDIRQYPGAVAMAREGQAEIYLATLRIQKPGELGLAKKLIRYQPDGLLVRNLAALEVCRQAEFPAVADFSLNVANQWSADFIRSLGASRVTISYDLNRDQLDDLVVATPSSWLELVIHQHMPMFHMEHCVFCAVLSPGTNKTNCGRPCDRHSVQLRDRIGMEHPLQADVGCRNTLYNSVPQSGSEVVGEMLSAGLRSFRVELLEDDATQTRRVLDVYKQLIAGTIDPKSVWQQLKAANRVGVTRGTLEQRRNPLAIV
jgi:putative protease